jgi:hypothetical protein
MLAVIVRSVRRTALALCMVLTLLGGGPGLAGATAAELSNGGIAELANKAAQEETSSTATAATGEKQEAESSSSSGTSGVLILALVAGVLLLGGVAFVIVRDARSVAPVVEGAVPGGSRNPQARLRKRRAQAKAAKRQRKRHRKR